MRCSDEMWCWRRVLYLAGLLRRRFGAVCGWVGRRHSHMLLSHNHVRVLCGPVFVTCLCYPESTSADPHHFGPAARGMKLQEPLTLQITQTQRCEKNNKLHIYELIISTFSCCTCILTRDPRDRKPIVE